MAAARAPRSVCTCNSLRLFALLRRSGLLLHLRVISFRPTPARREPSFHAFGKEGIHFHRCIPYFISLFAQPGIFPIPPSISDKSIWSILPLVLFRMCLNGVSVHGTGGGTFRLFLDSFSTVPSVAASFKPYIMWHFLSGNCSLNFNSLCRSSALHLSS
jgi:hypothetical protein